MNGSVPVKLLFNCCIQSPRLFPLVSSILQFRKKRVHLLFTHQSFPFFAYQIQNFWCWYYIAVSIISVDGQICRQLFVTLMYLLPRCPWLWEVWCCGQGQDMHSPWNVPVKNVGQWWWMCECIFAALTRSLAYVLSKIRNRACNLSALQMCPQEGCCGALLIFLSI